MLMVDYVKITATTVGTNEIANNKKNFSVFPIPSKGVFNVETADKVQGIRIYDANGKLVLENKGSKKADISKQPTGVYYMNIAFGNGEIATEKLIKE
jgi:predicted ThiF/HesA family dinucleotide-utilizing enzyme